MVSSYTPNKNLEKPGNGDYVDTWNVPLNSDMSIIDKALGGVLNLNATSGSALLTDTQYQNLIINVTGAMSASATYTIPSGVGGQWLVRNATTDSTGGPWTVTIASGGAGSYVEIVRGRTVTVWSDGTNIRVVEPNLASFGTVTSVGVSGGTTGLTTSGGPITSSGTITISGTLAATNGGTGITSLGSGIAAWLGTPSSANLRSAMTDETGSGSLVFASSPTISAPTVTGNTSFTGYVNFNSTGQIKLPVGTTGERAIFPARGMLRFNTTTSVYEGYNGTVWETLGPGETSLTFPYVIEPVQISGSGAGSTVDFYVETNSIANYTADATSNWTLNISFSNTAGLDSILGVGQGLTCAFLAKQGATPYYASVIQVDGTATGVTTRWQGGTAPTAGNANGVDIYTFTIIKTASATFDVYASQTQFA